MADDITSEHLEQLQQAKFLLENPSVAARFSDALATPIESGLKYLPSNARKLIYSASEKALSSSLQVALYTLDEQVREASTLTHKAFAAVSGAVGGAFGLPALAIELPLSTTIMMRSIADIARSEGEDLATYEARLACLQVFAFGSSAKSDDAAETGYFTIRAGLAKSVSEALKFASSAKAIDVAAPPLTRLVSKVATRFSIPVTEKAAAQAAPVVGALGGGLINTLFINHFQDIAKGHFVVRRLERIYGQNAVRLAYERL